MQIPEYRNLCRFIGGMLAVLVIWGCGNTTMEALREELAKTKTELAQTQSQNSRLQAELEKLRDQVEDLTIKNDMLIARMKEHDEWSDRLVTGYGTGVWYMAEFARPVFVESLPGASAAQMTAALNRRLAKDRLPTLKLVRVDRRKATVSITNEEMLTSRMGSSGAASYLNAVVYSLTSIKDIECVRFHFKGGSHAVPGQYCR